MRALLLAAGLGTRLRPLTNNIPKCLVPVNERPLLDYWLELLITQGIERVLINTHYLADVVKQYIAESRWTKQIEIVHEELLLGTGGTILHNRDFFKEQPFLVAHGDNLTVFDVNNLISRHEKRPNNIDITMMTFETDTPSACGIVEENDGGIVTAFHEKVVNPPGNRANGAVYIFEPSVIDFLVGLKSDAIDLSREVLPHFMGRIYTYFNRGYLRDIGTPESLHQAEKEIIAYANSSNHIIE